MTAKIIDGKQVAEEMRAELRREVAELKAKGVTPGLGVILVFVGLKMVWLNEAFGGKFPITWSLAIIGSILAISILVSIAVRRQQPQAN